MTPEPALDATVSYIKAQYAEPTTPLPTWRSEVLWAFPPANWRRRAAIALAVGVAAGWLLRGAR